MKNILFLLLLTVELFGQIQVSNIETLEYSLRNCTVFGFENETYLFNHVDNETQIFTFTQEGITFLQESEKISENTTITENLYFQYGSEGYTITDYTIGELLHSVRYPNEYSQYGRYTTINNHHITFVKDSDFNIYLHLYDMDSKQSKVLNIDGSRVLSNNGILYFFENDTDMSTYNFASGEREFLYSFSDVIGIGFQTNNNFYTINSNNKILLYQNGEIESVIDCFSSYSSISRIRFEGDYVFATVVKDTGASNLVCYKMSDCDLQLDIAPYGFLNSDSYPDNMLLLYFGGSYDTPVSLKWLSLDDFQVSNFVFESDEVFTSECVIGDILYKSSRSYFHENTAEIYTYNFISEEVNTVALDVEYTYTKINFTPSESGKLFISALTSNNEIQLWLYNTFTQEAKQIDSGLLKNNIGLFKYYFSSDTIDDGLLFFTRDQLFETENDETNLITDGLFYKGIKRINGQPYIYTLNNDSIFQVLVDNNLSPLKYTFITTYPNTWMTHKNTNSDLIYSDNNVYFNTISQSFETINFGDTEKAPDILSSSGNTILFTKFESSQRIYALYELETNLLTYLDSLTEASLEIFGLENSNYLCVESIYNGSPTQIFILDSFGNKSFIQDKTNSKIYYTNYLEISDNYISYPLQADDQTVFYLKNDTESKYVTITNEFTLYYIDLIHFRLEDDIFMQVIKDGLFSLVHLSWDLEPEYFGELNFHQTLKQVYTNSEYIFTFIEDDVSGSILLSQYDKFTKELINSKEIVSDVGRLSMGNKIASLSDSTKLLVMNDSKYGNELYVFDFNSLEVDLATDLYEGSIGSDPKFINKLGDDIYFLAHADDYSSQLFRYGILEDSIMGPNFQKDEKLVVSPNPARDMINLESPLENYTLYDRNGNVIRQKMASSTSIIAIEMLNPGSYFLIGSDVDGNTVSTKFVKM